MARRAIALALLVAAAHAGPAAAAAKLPKHFLWGVATAGFQGDMGPGAPNDPNSDWWAWVRDPENGQKKRGSGDPPGEGGAPGAGGKTHKPPARQKEEAKAQPTPL